MLNCIEVTRLHSESQERTLTLKERLSLELHMTMCSGCRNFGKQMRFLRKAAQTYARQTDAGAGAADE